MIPLPLNSELQPTDTVPIKREEAREQARLVAGLRRCWAKIEEDECRPVVFHIPNGGHRDPREASNLKVQGVLAGVPDLCIVLPFGGVVWIEMKASDGKTSVSQVALHSNFKALNHGVLLAYSAEEALDKLREALGWTN